MPFGHRTKRAAAAPLIVALVACASPTELHVVLDIDEALLPRERVLDVSAYDADAVSIYRAEQLVGGPDGVALPIGLRAVPRSDTETIHLRFVLRAGPNDERLRRDVVLAFVEGAVPTQNLRLDAACEEVRCDEGWTCACTHAGCDAPVCLAVGTCASDGACGDSGLQRCERGLWAPTCEDDE